MNFPDFFLRDWKISNEPGYMKILFLILVGAHSIFTCFYLFPQNVTRMVLKCHCARIYLFSKFWWSATHVGHGIMVICFCLFIWWVPIPLSTLLEHGLIRFLWQMKWLSMSHTLHIRTSFYSINEVNRKTNGLLYFIYTVWSCWLGRYLAQPVGLAYTNQGWKTRPYNLMHSRGTPFTDNIVISELLRSAPHQFSPKFVTLFVGVLARWG